MCSSKDVPNMQSVQDVAELPLPTAEGSVMAASTGMQEASANDGAHSPHPSVSTSISNSNIPFKGPTPVKHPAIKIFKQGSRKPKKRSVGVVAVCPKQKLLREFFARQDLTNGISGQEWLDM